jgi:hypothetical protein
MPTLPSWGSRGRGFKSRRPDWSNRFLDLIFGSQLGEPMAFPEQGQASSVAFAFRMRFTAVALSVRAGRIS